MLIALVLITTANLIFLDYAFSVKGASLISTGYLNSGLFFFLTIFSLYAISVWYRPQYSLGYWLHEFDMIKIMDRIMHKNGSSQMLIAAAEAKDNLRVVVEVEEEFINKEEEYRFLETTLALPEVGPYNGQNDSTMAYGTIKDLSNVILMDILLVISGRRGICIYLRNGRCVFLSKKMKDLFTNEQLAWLVSYQKGARVNLIHLIASSGDSIDQLWDKNTWIHFMDGVEKSKFELDDRLRIAPSYLENLAQQIQYKGKLDKTVLSRKII